MQAGLNNLIRIFSQVLSHINLHSAAGRRHKSYERLFFTLISILGAGRRHKQPHIINGKSG
jgi:hypothetical protein